MLSHLVARNFRNLEPLKWQPGPGSHLLLGGNGAGKTSLLEAIYFLATTRSFRTRQIADCARHGTDAFQVEGEVEDDRRWHLEAGWLEGKRMRAVNGGSTPLAEHLAVLPVVAWAAGEAEVLTGAPQLRRRFMDRGVVGLRTGALEVLDRYRQALRQKRDLLLGDQAPGKDGLAAWNEVLAIAAADLVRQRHQYVERLREELAKVLGEVELELPAIDLQYRPSPGAGLEGSDEVLRSLERAADRERRRQLPLVGPHRDDLEILWQGHEVRRVASAGERKALSLLLLSAHGRVLQAAAKSPLYLLDDADAELSPPTLSAVFKVFAGVPQLLASSNRPQVWLTIGVDRVWEVEKGRLAPL